MTDVTKFWKEKGRGFFQTKTNTLESHTTNTYRQEKESIVLDRRMGDCLGYYWCVRFPEEHMKFKRSIITPFERINYVKQYEV